MAREKIVKIVDDLDGTEGAQSYAFTWLDGKTYQIDLSDANADRLEDAVAEFIAAARRLGKKAKPLTSPARVASVSREENQAMRAWLRQNGHQVADRGRIPAGLVELYQQRAGRPAA